MKLRGVGIGLFIGCLGLGGAAQAVETAGTGAETESGLAAVYNDKLHGHRTACGDRYDRNALTTAHKTLPCNTLVKITNQKNKRSVTLRVNDRGPVQAGRIVDISPRAAKAMGMGKHGFFHVDLKVVGQASAKKAGHRRGH
jgi:rare lipoprotein A